MDIVATHAHFPSDEERVALTDAAERAFSAELAARHGTDGAYGHVQATRPDTLAAALNDSPAGLVDWLRTDPADVGARAVFIERHEAGYPESLARSHYRDLRVFDRLADGGHFAVAEVPDEVVARVRAFVGSLG